MTRPILNRISDSKARQRAIVGLLSKSPDRVFSFKDIYQALMGRWTRSQVESAIQILWMRDDEVRRVRKGDNASKLSLYQAIAERKTG